MSFKWRKFSIFGLMASIPVVVLLAHKISSEHQTAFEAHKETLFACDKCNRLFPHYGVRLAQHLTASHDIEENDAIELVDDLYKKFKAAQFKKWEGKL